MLIFHLKKFMKNIEIKFQKEDYKKYGGFKPGKTFFQNIILRKINIGIHIMQKILTYNFNKLYRLSLLSGSKNAIDTHFETENTMMT